MGPDWNRHIRLVQSHLNDAAPYLMARSLALRLFIGTNNRSITVRDSVHRPATMGLLPYGPAMVGTSGSIEESRMIKLVFWSVGQQYGRRSHPGGVLRRRV